MFGSSGKSDFATPDFLVTRCLPNPYQDVRAADVLLVGEVLSPSNSQTDMDDKRARCASGKKSAIAMIRTFALEKTHGALPAGVHPLHPANYLLTGKWTPKDSTAISMELPFPIHIPWPDLEF